jgi:hypothetical protein
MCRSTRPRSAHPVSSRRTRATPCDARPFSGCTPKPVRTASTACLPCRQPLSCSFVVFGLAGQCLDFGSRYLEAVWLTRLPTNASTAEPAQTHARNRRSVRVMTSTSSMPKSALIAAHAPANVPPRRLPLPRNSLRREQAGPPGESRRAVLLRRNRRDNAKRQSRRRGEQTGSVPPVRTTSCSLRLRFGTRSCRQAVQPCEQPSRLFKMHVRHSPRARSLGPV